VQEIVAAAGLTKGAFYHHFASKEDVLRILHDEFLEIQRALVDGILETYDAPVDQLRALVRTQVVTVAQNRAHVAVFFHESRYLTGERAADITRRLGIIEDRMVAIVQRGVMAGDFSPALDPRTVILGIVGMTAWVQQWYQPSGRRSADGIADELAQMTLDGLLHWNQGPADPALDA
jgi:AcrR family transcriptional regulator